MGKTFKESHYAGSKQSKRAAEYQAKKKIKHRKMDPYQRYAKRKDSEIMRSY